MSFTIQRLSLPAAIIFIVTLFILIPTLWRCFEIFVVNFYFTRTTASTSDSATTMRQTIQLSNRFLTASTRQQLIDIYDQMTSQPWPSPRSGNYDQQDKWDDILLILSTNHNNPSNRDAVKNRDTHTHKIWIQKN